MTVDRFRYVETVEFRARAGVPDAAVVAAVTRLEGELREAGGLVRQDLFLSPEGGLILVYDWKTLDDAVQSTGRVSAKPGFQELMSLVDHETGLRIRYGSRIEG